MLYRLLHIGYLFHVHCLCSLLYILKNSIACCCLCCSSLLGYCSNGRSHTALTLVVCRLMWIDCIDYGFIVLASYLYLTGTKLLLTSMAPTIVLK